MFASLTEVEEELLRRIALHQPLDENSHDSPHGISVIPHWTIDPWKRQTQGTPEKLETQNWKNKLQTQATRGSQLTTEGTVRGWGGTALRGLGNQGELPEGRDTGGGRLGGTALRGLAKQGELPVGAWRSTALRGLGGQGGGQGTRGGAEDLAVGYKWGKGSWDISNEKVLPS